MIAEVDEASGTVCWSILNHPLAGMFDITVVAVCDAPAAAGCGGKA
jgi:hypothetical protein